MAAVRTPHHQRHPVRGGVCQTHRWLHGPVPERSDHSAESRSACGHEAPRLWCTSNFLPRKQSITQNLVEQNSVDIPRRVSMHSRSRVCMLSTNLGQNYLPSLSCVMPVGVSWPLPPVCPPATFLLPLLCPSLHVSASVCGPPLQDAWRSC